MSISFPFPPNASGEVPVWCEDKFQVGTNYCSVLEYSLNHQGWSDELTFFHEETAGDHHFIDKASRDHAISQLKAHLSKENGVILEIGCSSGYMLHRIKNSFPNAFVMGADIVTEPLEKLSKELSNVPLLRFDLTQCPLPDNSVDAIILLNVLEHIKDDQLALKQICRILKPQGLLIIEVPSGPHLYDVYDKIMKHFRRYKLANLCALARGHELQIIKRSHLGFLFYPAFWLIKKRNKRLLSKSEHIQRQNVEKNIQQTGKSILMHMLMRIELLFGKFLSYPFGIRCLMTCKKIGEQ